jgi:uncharacterized protein YdaU (DUF1376 family)
MAKDPAFLFYSSDFLTGTMFWTNEQIGLYIRMLCAQHQHNGRIDTNVLRTQCDSITNGDIVYSKFKHDKYGSYNERLQIEMDKRKEKSIKASESVNKRWNKEKNKLYDSNTNVLRSENENENEDINKDDNNNGKPKKSKFIPPTLVEVNKFFDENGYTNGDKAWHYYEDGNWKDSNGKQVINWKQKMRIVWFKDENKKKAIRSIHDQDKRTREILGL